MKVSEIPAVNRILKKQFFKRHAPIVDLIAAQTEDPFQVLVATILSTRTRDECTAEVCDRVFQKIHKPRDFSKYTVKEIERLIFPIGFYRTKAKHLRELPIVLDRDFGGNVPDKMEELLTLPGVGRKVANLVISRGFNCPAICVDIHVHRISNRLGLLKSNTPEQTEMKLRKILPLRYWKEWNSYLVSFGQTICTPISPRCSICPLYKYCDRVGVTSSR